MFTHCRAAPLVVLQYACQVEWKLKKKTKNKKNKKSYNNKNLSFHVFMYNNENECDRCIENMLKSEWEHEWINVSEWVPASQSFRVEWTV